MSLPVKLFFPQEIKYVIRNEVNSRKAPGYDLNTGRQLNVLPWKTILLLTRIFNATLRTGYFPGKWKLAQMVLKTGKDSCSTLRIDRPSYPPSSYVKSI